MTLRFRCEDGNATKCDQGHFTLSEVGEFAGTLPSPAGRGAGGEGRLTSLQREMVPGM